MKAHIARSGKQAGNYVRCPALKHCTISPAADHANFAGRAEMMACNDVADMAPEFSDNSFVGDLLNEQHPGYDHWHAADGDFISYSKTAGAVATAGKSMSDFRSRLENGGKLDDDEYSRVLSASEKAKQALWGEHGLSSSHDENSSSSFDVGYSGDVVARGPWSHVTMVHHPYGDKDRGNSQVFTNGDTLVAVHDDYDRTMGMTMTMVPREHPNIRLDTGMPMSHHVLLKGNDTGDALNRIAASAERKFGKNCSVQIGSVGTFVQYEASNGEHYVSFENSDAAEMLGASPSDMDTIAKTWGGGLYDSSNLPDDYPLADDYDGGDDDPKYRNDLGAWKAKRARRLGHVW